jgi:hypothetical protein
LSGRHDARRLLQARSPATRWPVFRPMKGCRLFPSLLTRSRSRVHVPCSVGADVSTPTSLPLISRGRCCGCSRFMPAGGTSTLSGRSRTSVPSMEITNLYEEAAPTLPDCGRAPRPGLLPQAGPARPDRRRQAAGRQAAGLSRHASSTRLTRSAWASLPNTRHAIPATGTVRNTRRRVRAGPVGTRTARIALAATLPTCLNTRHHRPPTCWTQAVAVTRRYRRSARGGRRDSADLGCLVARNRHPEGGVRDNEFASVHSRLRRGI